jgi:hypothetical protein
MEAGKLLSNSFAKVGTVQKVCNCRGIQKIPENYSMENA